MLLSIYYSIDVLLFLRYYYSIILLLYYFLDAIIWRLFVGCFIWRGDGDW